MSSAPTSADPTLRSSDLGLNVEPAVGCTGDDITENAYPESRAKVVVINSFLSKIQRISSSGCCSTNLSSGISLKKKQQDS